MNAERWKKLPFVFQMGNVGSEINRTIHWQELGNDKNKEDALWRVLELLDLTIGQRKSVELLRLREVICDLFLGQNVYQASTKSLKEYFLNFALLANKEI